MTASRLVSGRVSSESVTARTKRRFPRLRVLIRPDSDSFPAS